MADDKNLKTDAKSLIRDIIFIVVIFLVITTFGFSSFHIPSSSMEPTLEVGDRLVVSKFSYGYNRYSMYFDAGWDEKIFSDPPKRGDVVVFSRPEVGPDDFIKRVIGLPGDRIAMRGGRLFINGVQVERRFVREVRFKGYQGIDRHVREYEETLPGGVTHLIYEASDNYPADNTAEIVVQSGYYFMMGDNRDRSNDSRSNMGQIPQEYLIGKALVTTFSLYDCDQGKDIYCPAGVPLGRFFNSID